ncbi:MAG: Gfo/Idh/MocA family oxidoreductase [Capsulimonadaceae bacterium]|nr:Gfo/Idh/MocA family oxidoreductase [Capsulimonadaceae bacterium]
MSNKSRPGLRVAVVGMGFGKAFVPIYLHHPSVSSVVVCDPSETARREIHDHYGVEETCADLSDILKDDSIDAVHLVTPIPLHAKQSIAVLESGKHCACTVPMACTLDDLFAIIAAQVASGKSYMMMETAVYTREFLLAKELAGRADFGAIQFLRGAHYQDMENWPPYWMGLPPMHYATHAISPLLAVAGSRATEVHCFGSGRMREELQRQYGNPYPIETAIFRLATSHIAAEVTRSLFETARAYTESFNVYGSLKTFEWQQIESDAPVLFEQTELGEGRGTRQTTRRLEVPDRADLLPPEIARFTTPTIYDETNPHRSFVQGGGHGGSHPHLVHEFISSIIEGRKASIDAITAANWTAAGICAHESAMRSGETVTVPDFSTVGA